MRNNDKTIGFDADLVEEIGMRTGYEMELRAYQFGELINALQDEALGMVASDPTIAPSREEIIDVSTPYFEDALTVEQYGLGFPEGPALRQVVNAALQEIKNDGTYAKIYRKWIVEDPPLIP